MKWTEDKSGNRNVQEEAMKQAKQKNERQDPKVWKGCLNSNRKEEEKVRRADHVIYNDDLQLVIPQVVKLHAQFLALTKQNAQV